MRLAVAAACAALAACSGITDPPLPREASRFTPPSFYARWWSMVESCSGRRGDLAKVAWYHVPGLLESPRDGRSIGGYYSRARHRIVLRSDMQGVGSLVRHEMLHALLGADGHSRGEFLGSCAGIVECDEACVSDGGAAPEIDRSLPRVLPSTMELSLGLDPSTPSELVDAGIFTFTVSVRNPFPHPVVVVFPPRPSGGAPDTFRFAIVTDGVPISRAALLLDPSGTLFAPGETKRHVFDLAVGGSAPYQRLVKVNPGLHEFRGAFGDHWASVTPVLLR